MAEKLTNREIGKRLKTCRTEKGMTLQDLASASGIDRSTVQRYESGGIVSLKPHVLEAIGKVLEVSPEWIVGETDVRESRKKDAPLPPDVYALAERLAQIPESRRKILMDSLTGTVNLFTQTNHWQK